MLHSRGVVGSFSLPMFTARDESELFIAGSASGEKAGLPQEFLHE